MMDFTLTTYKNLLAALNSSGYSFQTFQDFLKTPASLVVILRHDVDERPQNALKMACLEHGMGILATYYFRILKISNDPEVLAEIVRMGHEIGYHYEDLALAGGDLETAFRRFSENLAYFRRFYPIETICMHGSPMSRYDNRLIWEKYDYRELGIIAEPYFDIDFDRVFYLTDTGRRWDGWQSSVRDKMPQQADWIRQGLVFHTTADIIRAANKGSLPRQIMFTVHPQRWHDRTFPWLKELLLQNTKNLIKITLNRLKSK